MHQPAHANLMRFNELPAKPPAVPGEAAPDGRKVLGGGIFFVSSHSRNDYFLQAGMDLVMAPNQLLRIVKMQNSTAPARRFAAFVTRM